MYDQLKRSDEFEGVAVNVAEKVTAENYAKLRDQVWGALRDGLKEGGALLADSKLESELVAPKYRMDAQGRMVVESKDDMKKRLRRFPDRADALGLAVYSPSRGAGFADLAPVHVLRRSL